ncbi:MAG: 3-deoxy-7-phosphoheptulonate synthase [Verrucomicrobiota bacterium]
MIIVLKSGTSKEQIEKIKHDITDLGYDPKVIEGVERTIIGAVGDELSHQSLETLRGMPEVENVIPIQKRFKLASREYSPHDTVVKIGDWKLGGGNFQTIAGPCSIESEEQMDTVASDLSAAGIRILRGGAFKPRTSPYDFQGLGKKGLDILQNIKDKYNMAIVTEVMGIPEIKDAAMVADMIQIGARNCQNYHLLKEVAQVGRPVLLKRGMATKTEEWLAAAEYLLTNGCDDVVLCERGIRTFETATRNTMDVSGIALARQWSHLPVIADPSHAAGIQHLVLPLSCAAIGAGADGLIIEVHPDPIHALSDAPQQMQSGTFRQTLDQLEPFIKAAGKHMISLNN